MIGLGVSSFSHFGGVNFQNAPQVEDYLRVLETDELQLWRALPLTAKQMLIREMILQLKTGVIDTEYFSRKFGTDVWQEFRSVYEKLEKAELLERIESKIVLTRRGLLEVDHFLSEFFEPELRSVRYV
jgi:oxygen-independent coproporphyrinogen-3 oxidase